VILEFPVKAQDELPLPSAIFRPSSLVPTFNSQTFDSRKLVAVPRRQHRARMNGVRCDQQVHRPDRSALGFQRGAYIAPMLAPDQHGLAEVWQRLSQIGVKWPCSAQSPTHRNLDNIWLF
jgi:hypothetical protein